MKDSKLHFRTPLITTPFHARTSAANKLNAWAPWAGYTTALSYSDETMEYTALRNQAGLYDLSPMVKYAITGPDALRFLNRLTLRDVSKLQPGNVHYTAWCDDAGKLIDDGTLFHLAPGRYRLCCQERHLPWLLDSAIGFDVSIEDESEKVAALSLQGPCSFAILARAGLEAAQGLKPFQLMDFAFDGGMLTISRTGFTADLGYELWTTPQAALSLWDHLMVKGADHGLRPIGTTALNMTRIEAGFMIANMDFVSATTALRPDRLRSPFDMGLEWMIDFNKGHFNGRAALKREKESGSTKWAFVGLDIEGNVEAEHALIYDNRKTEVGHITASLWSPTVKRNIALAMLRRPYHAERSGNLWVEIYALRELEYHKLMVKAQVVPRQFFNPPRRRANPPGLY
ncbi:MAG: aminomethyltransferase family protein [Rhizobiales bacterium]|nr:aminomethyltransferase family protein [Hyphomicrobiales bacterium]